MPRKKDPNTIKVRGFYRLNIVNPDGSVDGDSGWLENQVTDLGFNKFLVMSLGSISGSAYLTHVALGTGTIPGAGATGLDGEIYSSTRRQTLTNASTSSSSKSLVCTATFASTVFTTATTIANIGLFNSSATGSIFAGSTYSSSTVNTNQAVNITYQINFS